MVYCATFGVTVKSSNIQHDSVGRGVFSGQPVVAGEIVGDFYGILVYLNLTTREQVREIYNDCIMIFAVEKFSTWSFNVLETFVYGIVENCMYCFGLFLLHENYK